MGKIETGDLKVKAIALSLVCAVMIASGTGGKQVTAAETDQPDQVTSEQSSDVDEEALTILKKATDYLTGLTQFRLKGFKETDVVQESGQKFQFSSSAEVYLKRPDRMFVLRTNDDGILRRFWYDGKTVNHV